MYVFPTLLIIVISIAITWLVRKQRYIRKCLECFPGPAKVFFFGDALDFFGDKGMLAAFREYQKEYGDIVYGRMGPSVHMLLITSADFAKEIFLANTNLSKGSAYDDAKSWLGEGLLTTPEEKWRHQRKILTPAFNNQLLIDFISVFDEQSSILVEKINEVSPKNSVNVHRFISLCSLDIISKTSMGVLLNAQENQNIDYVESVKEMCRIIAVKSLSVWKSCKPLYIFSEDYQKERKSLKILHGYTDRVINERKKQRKEMNKKQNEDPGTRGKSALLDILLDYSENEKLLSEQEIRQEVHTFMFAGHDTVTAAMDFFIYEIAKHPHIQKAIYDEQRTIFGTNIERATTVQDIHDMRYLEMVIKEALRLYPSVPVYTRLVTKEFVYDGKTIPKGALLVNFSYGLHRNEKYFPNPDVFDPTRFEVIDGIVPHSFLPFSTGPRNCIGQKFAMYEMKVILSKLLRHFEFSPAVPEHTLDLRAEVVLLSRTGVNVKIFPRKER